MVSVSPLLTENLIGKVKFKLQTPYQITPTVVPHDIPSLLDDGIYSQWPIFAKLIYKPEIVLESKFRKKQEAVRTDIKRWFRVLQARFKILLLNNASCDIKDVVRTSETCVILQKKAGADGTKQLVRERGSFKS